MSIRGVYTEQANKQRKRRLLTSSQGHLLLWIDWLCIHSPATHGSNSLSKIHSPVSSPSTKNPQYHPQPLHRYTHIPTFLHGRRRGSKPEPQRGGPLASCYSNGRLHGRLHGRFHTRPPLPATCSPTANVLVGENQTVSTRPPGQAL